METDSFSELKVPGEITEVVSRLGTPEPPFFSVLALINLEALTQGKELLLPVEKFYSEDANDGTLTYNPSVINRVL